MRRTLLIRIAVLWLLCGGAGACRATVSLFPPLDPLERLAEIDAPRSRLSARATCWQPFGLPGVLAQEAEVGCRLRGLGICVGWAQQDWGVIRASGLRARVVGGRGGTRLGLAAATESLEGGSGERSVDALAAGGGDLRLSARYRLWESDGAVAGSADASGLLGLSWRNGAWTLGGFKTLGGEGSGEGLCLSWEEGPFRIRALSGSSPWQGVELAFRRGRVVVALRVRMHAWLGMSRGVSLLVL